MNLGDFYLKTKVHAALALNDRISLFHIGVDVNEGIVTLRGPVRNPAESDLAEEIARGVDGVHEVRNQLTAGQPQGPEETAEMIIQRLLNKLDEEWRSLPDQSAMVQADYLRWALWLIHKFRLTNQFFEGSREELEARGTELALERVAGYVHAPKALLALMMSQLAQTAVEMAPQRAPEPISERAGLISTPETDGGLLQPAA